MQGIGLASQVTGAVGEDREPLAEGSIQTLDESGFDDTATLAELQQVIDHFLATLDNPALELVPFTSQTLSIRGGTPDQGWVVL